MATQMMILSENSMIVEFILSHRCASQEVDVILHCHKVRRNGV
jgi:hypothetical protein